MKKIIDFFVERSFVVNMISLFIFIVGILAFTEMRRDLIPSFKFKVISIRAALIGASAVDIEKHVTFPIEESIKNLSGIKEVTSYSRSSSSYVKIKFDPSFEEIQEAVENIKSRIDSIKSNLPSGMEPISVTREKVDSVRILGIGVTGVNQKNDSDRVWVKSFEEKLVKVPGVIAVDNYMKKRRIYIKFDNNSIVRHKISIPHVRSKIYDFLRFTPIGNIEKGDKIVSIELKKDINNLKSIANLPILSNMSGNVVLLKDIAKIEYKFPKSESVYLLNGKDFIYMSIHKDMNSDAIDVRDNVVEIIDEYNEKFPNDINARLINNGPSFIEKQLDVLKSNGLVGIVLVCITLYFLVGLRVSLMTAIGIPLSYCGTFAVLHYLGISIDLISVVGMILVVGILVDDAIIVAEKYVQNLEAGMTPKKSASDAARSTIIPVTGTVLTTIVAFAPILLIKSEASEILYAIPCVIISALVISWFESFFILPNHLQHFVKTKSKRADSKIFNKIREYYKTILRYCLKFRYVVFVGLIAFMGFSIYWAVNFIDKKFNLKAGSGYLRVTAVLKDSKSLDETRKILSPIHEFLNKLPEEDISHVTTDIGDIYINHRKYKGPQYAKMVLNIPESHKDQKGAIKRIQKIIEDNLDKYKTSEFKELYIKSKMQGNEKSKDDIITIFVSGGDTVSFEGLQKDIEKSIKTVKNIESVFIDEDRLQETWQFIPDMKELLKYSIDTGTLVSQLGEYFSPRKLDQIRLSGEDTNIYTQYYDIDNIKYNNLNKLEVIGSNGVSVPITFLGHWKKVKNLKVIEHENLLRMFEIDVRYNTKKTKKAEIAEEIKKSIQPIVKKYPEYNFSVLSEDKSEKEGKEWAIKILIVCVILILLVLSLCLNSIIQPLLVSFAIPFGIIGIIWALYFHGKEFGFMAIIGLVGMAGVVVNDSLIMVDFINTIKKTGKLALRDSIIEGASQRLRAILMTTITTLGGVFPMAYGLGGDSGFTTPLAFSMGWGLTFATLLTLFALPALLEILEDFVSIGRKMIDNRIVNTVIAKIQK